MDPGAYRVLYDFLSHIPAHRANGADAPPQCAVLMNGHKRPSPGVQHLLRQFIFNRIQGNHPSCAHIVFQGSSCKGYIGVLPILHLPASLLFSRLVLLEEMAAFIFSFHHKGTNAVSHSKAALIGQASGLYSHAVHGPRHHGKASVAAFPSLFTEFFLKLQKLSKPGIPHNLHDPLVILRPLGAVPVRSVPFQLMGQISAGYDYHSPPQT